MQAFPAQNAEQPGTKLAMVAQLPQLPVGLQQRFLHQILGIFRPWHEMARRTDQRCVVLAHQALKRR